MAESAPRPTQLTLDLGHRPALGREDFLVAPCNETAVGWIDLWPGWPSHALVLYGPPACGKTHLALVWQARAGAKRLEAARIAADDAAWTRDDAPAYVVEDVPAVADERAFLHLYNAVGERGGHLLLTARQAPALWRLGLPDLVSRLRAIPAVALGAPDDAVLGAVMVKLFADRQLEVGEDVLAYLLARIERSFAGAHAIVAALDTLALAERRAITIPLARRALEARESAP